MRLKTAIAAAVTCFALAVPSAAFATSPTQDAYSGIAGQQQGSNGTPSNGTPSSGNLGQESSGNLGQLSSGNGNLSHATSSKAAETGSSGILPFTGLEIGLFALVGVGLLGGGILLFRVSRRAEPQV
jgi:hypothetical protein